MILNIQLTDVAWEHATLLEANSGIGFQKATQVALPAFLSSVAGAEPLISQLLPDRLHPVAGTNDPLFRIAVEVWCTQVDSVPVQSASSTSVLHSAEGMGPVQVKLQESKLLSAVPNQADEARPIAAAAPHSGTLLHACPCSALGTRLDSSFLRSAVALWLGTPVCSSTSVYVEQLSTAQTVMESVAESPPVECLVTAPSMT